jgi:CofH/MqnC C-terminal region
MAMTIDAVTDKIQGGGLLSDADIETLEAERDIITLGTLADSVRRRLRGNTVTFVRVFDLKVTPGYFGPVDIPSTAGEVRVFDTPETLDEAISVVDRALELAGRVPLSAFCLFELSKLAEGLPVVLPALRKAGLELIAQAPLDRLPSPERALEAVTDAGLRLTRLTIDQAPVRRWTSVCREVAAHQRRLQSIPAFAPLARRIDETQPTTGYADVKRVALARMLIQNVDTIQVDWALYGPKLAQVALTFGADDLDSVDPFDDESQGRRRSPLEEIRRSIQAASFSPVERDGRFRLR